MALITLITAIFLTYYIFYLASLISTKNRKGIAFKNKELDVLRSKPVKTLKEQKEFLNLKQPKHKKFKFSWKGLGTIILKLGIYGGTVFFTNYLFNLYNINIKIWHLVCLIIFLPLILNWILKKFNLEKNSLLDIIGGVKK